jgi:prophage maintenance system killer protein
MAKKSTKDKKKTAKKEHLVQRAAYLKIECGQKLSDLQKAISQAISEKEATDIFQGATTLFVAANKNHTG